MTSVGILGSGQLARFLATEAHRLGIPVGCIGASPHDPAAHVQSGFTVGSLDDLEDLENFFRRHTHITFESEFIDEALVTKVQNTTNIKCFPDVSILGRIQDRASQKKLLENYKIPTLPAIVPESSEHLNQFYKKNPKGLVLKKRRFGYDGYGTFILRKPDALKKFIDDNADLSQFIAEPLVRFQKELAVTIYRSASGSSGSFPLVEWKAKDSKCWWVKGPIRNRRFEKLKPQLLKFLRSIDYVGVMAFEMFETRTGLIVNELAPRVHNSAHYTMNATAIDQFSMHLLCVTGKDVPRLVPAISGGFAMVNLIGSRSATPELIVPTDAWLHWYEKKENRPGRKMGHINAVAKTPDQALKQALRSAKKCRL